MPTTGKRGPTATWLWTELKRLGLPVFSKVDPLTTAYIVGAALLLATPSLIFFG